MPSKSGHGTSRTVGHPLGNNVKPPSAADGRNGNAEATPRRQATSCSDVVMSTNAKSRLPNYCTRYCRSRSTCWRFSGGTSAASAAVPAVCWLFALAPPSVPLSSPQPATAGLAVPWPPVPLPALGLLLRGRRGEAVVIKKALTARTVCWRSWAPKVLLPALGTSTRPAGTTGGRRYPAIHVLRDADDYICYT